MWINFVFCRSDTLTFQALSDDDRKLWMDAMDGREPVYTAPNTSSEDCMYLYNCRFMQNWLDLLSVIDLYKQLIFTMWLPLDLFGSLIL